MSMLILIPLIMKKILIALVCIAAGSITDGQKLLISDAVTGIAFKASDNVTFTRTVSYRHIFKYEKDPDGSQKPGANVKVSYPDRPNSVVESFTYLGPDYVYEFKSGDPELENKSANGQPDYYYEKRIIISVTANGYEKGTINIASENYYTGGSWPSKSYSHVKLVPLK
jgi:hypothetical protein